MKIVSSLLALPLSAGLMLAQTATPQQTTPQQTTATPPMRTSTPMESSSQSGQSWTGILTASNCSTSNMPASTASAMNQSTPKSEMSQTTPMDRGTKTDRDMNRTPARDVNQGTGTDSQLERTRTMEPTTGAADRRGTPTDTQAGNNMATSTEKGMRTGEVKTAGNWDKSCYIGKSTSSFTFQTKDGRMLHFDSDGDSKIKSQLDSSSRVASKSKIFRVKVTGSVDGDTIHLTNIVM